MKIELPSKQARLLALKFTAYFIVPVLAVAWWVTLQDPNLGKIEAYLSKSPEVMAKLGKLEEVSLYKKVYIQDAVAFDGSKTLGVTLYSFNAKGNDLAARIKVKASQSESGERSIFNIKEIKVR